MNQLLKSFPLKTNSILSRRAPSLNFLKSRLTWVRNVISPIPKYSEIDKELEIAKAWNAASADIYYYNDTLPVKTPSYYPFLKIN